MEDAREVDLIWRLVMRAHGNPVFVADGEFIELQQVKLAQKDLKEKWLQRLIQSHPHCLPIREIEPGFGDLVSICRELPTRHGLVDNLLMTSDGDIVLVETKLWRNPEARREVVAQALDYASCLFEMEYSDLERAVLQGDFGGAPRPASLLELFPEPDAPSAVTFVDAVNTNLRRGRIVVLVVGDGIRSEAERLASSLQSHAGFHFTFALVELAVFVGPGGRGHLVQPRTLAKTCMIDRGVVRIDDRRVFVSLQEEQSDTGPRPQSITAEQFYESMAALDRSLPARLQQFIDDLGRFGIYPDFKKSLNLKWDPPSGKAINLSYIQRDGQLCTEVANWTAPHELSHAYQEDLARVLGGEVDRSSDSGNWYVKIGGSMPRIHQIADRLNEVRVAMERFIDRIRDRHALQDDA